jgi:hypothetical protein
MQPMETVLETFQARMGPVCVTLESERNFSSPWLTEGLLSFTRCIIWKCNVENGSFEQFAEAAKGPWLSWSDVFSRRRYIGFVFLNELNSS